MEFLKNKVTQVILLCIAILLLAFACQFAAFYKVNSKAESYFSHLNNADSIQENILTNTVSDSSTKQKTLKSQYYLSQKIKSYYKQLSLTYYSNYYSFSICSILFSLLLSLGVFLMAIKGWQESSMLLKSFTLSSIMLASFYYLLPNVLNNKANFQENISKVKTFQKIQFDILSFANLYHKMDEVKVDSALTSNYNQIVLNYDYISTIDNSSINTNPQDMLKTIKP